MSVIFNFNTWSSIVPARRFERVTEPGFLTWYGFNQRLVGDGSGGAWTLTFTMPDATMQAWAWRWGGLMMVDDAAATRAVGIKLDVTVVGGFEYNYAIGGAFGAGAGVPTFGGFPGNFPGSNPWGNIPTLVQPRSMLLTVETSNPGVGDFISLAFWLKAYDPRE